jgi:hypothetical protein
MNVSCNPRRWVWLLLLALPQVCPAEAIHVANDGPAQPPRTIQLEELWRIGGDQGDLLLGTVSEVTADPAGNVYVLDSQLRHVEVISPTGEHVGTLSREGDGPGEVRMPRDVVFLADGTLGIAELFPAKLVRMTPDGEPRPSIMLGSGSGPVTGLRVTIGCENRGATLLLAGHLAVQGDVGQDRTQFLCTIGEDGAEQARFCQAEMALDFQRPRILEREILPGFFVANAIGPDGRIYAPRSRDAYVIDVYLPDGTLERVIEREFDNRPRTARETRRIEAVFNAAARQIPGEIVPVIEPANPVIAGLSVDEGGDLWVKHSRSGDDRPPGVLLTYDRFDPTGRYVQAVSIACEGDPAYDDLEFLPDGRVLLIKGYVLAQWSAFDFGTVDWDDDEETAEMEIVCCRMAE